jgi:transcriptional regulator with XRE-family HTH domain
MINHKQIGRQIRELRIRRGWKQYELADKVGMSRPAICNIEAGKRSLTLNTLKRFCEVFAIDISYFGIETDNLDESIDIISRLDAIFNSDLPTEKKEELYRKIMKIYLDSTSN